MFELIRLYDDRFDIIDLKITDDYEYDYSIEVDSLFIIDISKDKRIVAFEIIDASRYFNVDKKFFYQSEWCIKVKVTEDVIKLYLTLKVEDDSYVYHDKVINKDDVVPGDYIYANCHS